MVAALLGIDRGLANFEEEWARMRRLRIEAAESGKPVTWDDLG